MSGFGVNSSSFVVEGSVLGGEGDTVALRRGADHNPLHWHIRHTSLRRPKLWRLSNGGFSIASAEVKILLLVGKVFWSLDSRSHGSVIWPHLARPRRSLVGFEGPTSAFVLCSTKVQYCPFKLASHGRWNLLKNAPKMAQKEREKEEFFDKLYRLDNDDDDDDDDGEINTAALILEQSRKRATRTNVAVTPQLNESVTKKDRVTASSHTYMKRTVSAPLPVIPTTLSKEVELLKNTPTSTVVESARQRVELHRGATLLSSGNVSDGSVNVLKKPSKMTGKRKRGKSPKMMPLSQQIFKGLQFCTFMYSSS